MCVVKNNAHTHTHQQRTNHTANKQTNKQTHTRKEGLSPQHTVTREETRERR